MYRILLLFFALGACSSAITKAQNAVSELPVHYGQYFNNPQINPANGNTNNHVDIALGTRKNNGNFGEVANTFFSTFIKLKQKSESGFNSIGLLLNSDKEGPIIRRNRVYASFARHQRISNEWTISAGVSFGFFNFGIKATEQVPGASAYALDGNAGVLLYSNKTKLSFSLNQFSAPVLRPLEQAIQLSRHFNAILQHTFQLSNEVSFMPSAFLRYLVRNTNPYVNTTAYGLSSLFIFKNTLDIGAGYEAKEGTYTFLGVRNIKIGPTEKNHSLQLLFSYFIPSRLGRTNTQAFEVVLRYAVTKNN